MNQKISVTFSKKGDMRFISHLDLMRLFQRSLRRAALPITITKGFNPHPKISMGQALRLGAESSNEEAIFYLDENIDLEEFKTRFNEQLPEGIRIQDAKANIG
jgi:radical SAM-linked protein